MFPFSPQKKSKIKMFPFSPQKLKKVLIYNFLYSSRLT